MNETRPAEAEPDDRDVVVVEAVGVKVPIGDIEILGDPLLGGAQYM